MTNNFAHPKQRLMKYLDFKGISKAKFYRDTAIKRGFLDSNKLESSISNGFLTKIIAYCDDLSVEWLLNSSGEMIKQNNLSFIKNGDSKIEVAKIVDLIIDHNVIFEHDKRFMAYIDNHKKDAIIAYQKELIEKSKN